jgi:hypothetical protein
MVVTEGSKLAIQSAVDGGALQKERPVYTIADQMAVKLYIGAVQSSSFSLPFGTCSLKAEL